MISYPQWFSGCQDLNEPNASWQKWRHEKDSTCSWISILNWITRSFTGERGFLKWSTRFFLTTFMIIWIWRGLFEFECTIWLDSTIRTFIGHCQFSYGQFTLNLVCQKSIVVLVKVLLWCTCYYHTQWV